MMKFLVTIDSCWRGELLQIGFVFFRSASGWWCSSLSVFGGNVLMIKESRCMVASHGILDLNLSMACW
jgi:hypothetical protein